MTDYINSMTQKQKLAISYIDPSRLVPNQWNTNQVSPENEQKIEESLTRFGAFKPILVRTLADGTLEILGGEHRTKVAVKMGIREVPVINLGKVSDKEAKEIGLVDNGRYGQDDTLGLAKLLEELGTKDELSTFLPYDHKELDQIFGAVEVDLDALDIPEDKETLPTTPASAAPQTHQTMKFRVRVEDAHFVSDHIERVMKEQGFNKDAAEINAGDALVHVFKNLK